MSTTPFRIRQMLNSHHEVIHFTAPFDCQVLGCGKVGGKGIKGYDNLVALMQNTHWVIPTGGSCRESLADPGGHRMALAPRAPPAILFIAVFFYCFDYFNSMHLNCLSILRLWIFCLNCGMNWCEYLHTLFIDVVSWAGTIESKG